MKIPEGVKYIIGVDEAGRGPLAGPVAVGVCLVSADMTRRNLLAQTAKSGLKKLRDSKKLSEKMRDAWFAEMLQMQKQNDDTINRLNFAVTLVSNKIIDKRGLTFAIKKAMGDALEKVRRAVRFKPSQCLILLDGGLRAPSAFAFQKTIIRGDEKEFAISLASIAAKVTRDTYMKKNAKKYPAYNFQIHKGYGTARHISAIKKEGISPIHRTSFLKNIII